MVSQGNSGLQLSCDTFNFGDYDIYISNGSIASSQGSSQQGTDNKFVNTQVRSLYNPAFRSLNYYHSPKSCHVPYNPYNFTVHGDAGACGCAPTLCDNNTGPMTSIGLAGFQSDVDAYTSAVGSANTDGMDNGVVGANDTPSPQDMRQSLSDTYHAAVRALMSDSLLDLSALEQWHTSANLANLANDVNIADPYSLTETRFMEGYAETFAEDAETDSETANYAEFHTMKLTLRGDNNDNMDNYDNNNSSNSPNSPSNSQTLSLKFLPAGIYLLRVTDMEGKEYHRKVVRR